VSKASRLEPIADYATLRENEAAQRLAASAAQLEAKEKELEQLRGYLAEYRQRALNESTDSTRLQNTRAFLARLSDAVAFHEAEMQKAIERIASSPELRRAMAEQSSGMAREMVGGVRRTSASLDDVVEQRVRGWLGRPRTRPS